MTGRCTSWLTHVVVTGLTLTLAGCATTSFRFPGPDAATPALTGSLTRPDGPGPFPAVVLLHTCSGIGPRFEPEWARWFRADGYVALLVDSFSQRGISNVCAPGSPGPTMSQVGRDALAALDHLRSLPFVDGRRIAVVGWSYGGGAVLNLAAYQPTLLGMREPDRLFHAAVAFYPPCMTLSQLTMPTLMLMGAADDWTPPQNCVTSGQRLRAKGEPIDWVVYPGAFHSFDRAEFGTQTIRYMGKTSKYDGLAAADAEVRVRRFLRDVLK